MSDNSEISLPVAKKATVSTIPKWEEKAKDRIGGALKKLTKPTLMLKEKDAAEADTRLQPGRAMEEGELRTAMRTEISKLPEREQAILILYYDDGLTLSEIGEALGVTESRISQIHTKAVLQLRSRLAAAGMG